jgi:plasmid maintenance system antidote protein VapI
VPADELLPPKPLCAWPAFFGTDAQSWLNLQSHYDLECLELKMADEVTPFKEAA